MTSKRLVDLITTFVQEAKRLRDTAVDETRSPEARLEAAVACLDACGPCAVSIDKMSLDGLKLLKLNVDVEIALREAYGSDAPLPDTPTSREALQTP